MEKRIKDYEISSTNIRICIPKGCSSIVCVGFVVQQYRMWGFVVVAKYTIAPKCKLVGTAYAEE